MLSLQPAVHSDRTTVQLPAEAVPHYEAALEIVRRLGVRRPWQRRRVSLLWRSPSPPLCKPRSGALLTTLNTESYLVCGRRHTPLPRYALEGVTDDVAGCFAVGGAWWLWLRV